VHQAVDRGHGHRRIAEHDTTPQDRNGCQPACGSSMRPTRFTVSGLRSAQARRVGGSAGSGSFFPTAGTAGSRGRPLISTMRLVRPGRIVICRRYRYAPCFPWRNTCEQGFPLRERRSMEHRARQLTLPFGPALPDHSLILAPRVWPMMTPRAQQQLAQGLAQLLRTVLAAADAGALRGGCRDEHAAQFRKSGDDVAPRQAGIHLRTAVDRRSGPPASGKHGAAIPAGRSGGGVWLAQGTD
jgi:hypothetical protein